MSCNKANMFGKTLHFNCFRRGQATGVVQDVVLPNCVLHSHLSTVQCYLGQLTMIIFWGQILGLLKKRVWQGFGSLRMRMRVI